MAALFNEDFLRRVARLRIAAHRTAANGRHAEHRSAALGAGMEFRDFRAYAPGDDLRRVDFNLYRRSGRLFLRLFEEPRDYPVYVLLDSSDSMYFEQPPRANAARLMAGVVLAAALNQHDRAELHAFGSDLLPALNVTTGKRGLLGALTFIEGLGPAGMTNLGQSIRRFAAVRRRKGLAVVISDFFDPRGTDAIIDALRRLHHDLLLIQVYRPADADPTMTGELMLVDCESNAQVVVTIDAAARRRYQSRYQDFCGQLRSFAARRRSAFLMLNADRSVFAQIGGIFRNGVLYS